MKYTILIFLVFGFNLAFSQNDKEEVSPASSKEEIEKQYKRNIRKSHIDGTYIPKDIDDAFIQLKKLSKGNSFDKFKNAPEEGIAKKLHFGIGQWMIVNWRFYDGSRFSYFLKELGLGHPDDMADFMIIVFHRSLNKKELGIKELVTNFQDKRLEEYKKRTKVVEIIKKK